MTRISSTALAMFCIAVAGPPAAAAGLTPDGGKVFRSTRGEEVDVVMLKPQTDGNAVIRVTGTSSVLDGLALPYKHSIDGNHEFYTTTWHGRQLSLVQADHRSRERWELYVPNELNRSRPIAYDDNLTKTLPANEILMLYEKQLRDGTIQKFAAFNRAEEQAHHDKALAESVATADKACGGHTAARIVWSTVDDETLKKYGISSYCSSALSALESLCRQTPVAAAALRDKVKALSCGWSPTKFSLAAGNLEFNFDAQSSNLEQLATTNLEALEVAAPTPKSAGEQSPWGDGHTLGQRITLARSTVCTDGKNHYVVHIPHAPGGPRMYYGDGKKLAKVPVADLLGSGTFFEPRQFNPTANSSFRGADVRLYSSVEVDEAQKTCMVQCGTRKTELKIMPVAEASQLLTSATYLPPGDRHAPHSLNRDEKGNYYYVDKGSTPETAKDFRLFVGPKGNMKRQQMTNVVSDSQGEIFSTKTGELRFIVGPSGRESTWVKGANRLHLLAVPAEENWQMIYSDLGVYVGEKRSTPCDDF